MPSEVYSTGIPPSISALYNVFMNARQGGKSARMPVDFAPGEPYRIMRNAEVEVISSRPLTTTDGIVPEEVEPEEIATLREMVATPEQKPMGTMVTT